LVSIIGAGILLLILSRFLAAGNKKKLEKAMDKIAACADVLLIVFIVFSLIFFPIMGGAYTKSAVYNEINTQAVEIDSLPDTTSVRYLPMEVAEYYADNQLSRSEVKIWDIQPIIMNDSVVWSSALSPDGSIRKLTRAVEGVAIVKDDGKLVFYNNDWWTGPGMYIQDNIAWKLYMEEYWCSFDNPYYLQDGDEWVLVVPFVSYRFEWPVQVPYWGGVAIARANGELNIYTPEEAMALDFTQGHRLFPEKLALTYADSYAYSGGIGNKFFIHQDQIQIPKISNSSNQMPYLIPTDEGPQWLITAEPHGEAYAIYKVFLIDAHSGQIKVYNVPEGSTLIGPNRVLEYIKQAYPEYKWGSIVAVEPRPVVKDGHLYWMMTITTQKHGGVVLTVLVDAENPEVTYGFETKDGVMKFISDGYVPEKEQPIIPVTNISSDDERIQYIMELLNSINLTDELQIIDEINQEIEKLKVK
jgi:hypothetical protein